MAYQVNPKVHSELKTHIQNKVQEAKDSGQIKHLMHEGASFEFYRIKINRDWLYYNLENDRTLTKTREFIDKRAVDLDYFSESSFLNIDSQKHYHDIIKEFIPSNMPKILNTTGDQRDPLFITQNGIMANGNTRLCCFREESLFPEVECLVFKEDYADDWDFIRQFVDLQDNAEDFSSDYPWYARAERIELNIKKMGTVDYAEIAKRMQYKDSKEAELNHGMLKLAREFVNSKLFPKYTILSDLDYLADSGSGLYSFTTLAKMMRSHHDIDHRIKTKLKFASFATIGSGNNGTFSSTHLAVSNTWAKAYILKEQRKIDNEAAPNILGGNVSNEQDSSTPAYVANPFKDKTAQEIKKVHDEIIEEVALVKATATNSSLRESYKTGLRQILSKWENLNNLSLNDDSNLEDIENLFNDVDEILKNSRAKASTLKS